MVSNWTANFTFFISFVPWYLQSWIW